MAFELLGGIVLVGALATTAILVTLHFLPTGLSALRDPVSQYALTRFGVWYRAATLTASITGAVCAVLVGVRFVGAAAVITVILLVFFAAARLLIGFFPMDEPAALHTKTGSVHTALAFVAFAAVTAVAFVAGGAFHDNGDAALATCSTVTGVVMAVGTIGMLVTSRSSTRRGFGASERLIYLGFIAWFIGVGLSTIA